MTFLHCSPAKKRFVSAAAKFPSILFAICSLVAFPAFAATPCIVPSDCTNAGTAFCVNGFCCNTVCNGACDACSAAVKGGGVDGECGLAAEGSTCKNSYCNGNTFEFVGPSKCTATGACIAPAPVSCLEEKPCILDLCSDIGCEHLAKIDGSECGNGMVCIKDECVAESASTSSSSISSSGAGVGGAGGSGGAGGIGGKGGSGGLGGSGGTSGADGSSSSGQLDPYPPSTGKGCTCSTTDSSSSTGPTTALFAIIAVALRRSRRSASRGNAHPF